MNRRLWLLLLALMSPAANALQPIPVSSSSEGLPLLMQVEVLRDKPGQLTFAEVTQPAKAAEFAAATAKGLNFGFTRDAFWYRFALDNRVSDQAFDGVLEVGFPPLDFLDLHVVHADGSVEEMRGGDQRPPGASGIQHHNHAFTLHLAAGELATIYLRAQIDGAHQVPLMLWSREAFFHKTARENIFFGMFYGIMLVMVIYNLLTFVFVRDRAYLYYLLFVANIALLLVNLDGFAFPWLWSLAPQIINGSIAVSIALSTIFVPMFISVSLQTRQFTPRLHRALMAMLWLAAVSVVLPLVVPVMEATFINALIGALTTVVMATVVIVQALNGRRTARFYALVWAALLIGILTKVLETNGVLPVNAFTTYSIHLGASLLVTLVSLGLADQINQERRERARLAREKVEAQAATKSEFLAKMSHELRTPMNAIIGFTDLALRSDSDARRIEHLGHIDTASHSLLHILNDVLDLTKIESGKLSLESTAFELQPVLDKAASLMSREADARNIELLVTRAVEVPPMLTGDPLRLEQVLVNLVGNAVKFTESGEVELRATRESQDEHGVRIRFSVRDTGIGIPPDRLPKLFTPFTQVDQSTTRKYGGSGLGLAVCKQLVELMGGEIRVDSEPGQGSEFQFSLSFAPAPAAPVATHGLVGKQVLIADANRGVQRMYAEIFQTLGMKTQMTLTTDGIFATLENAPCDAVLLDSKLPGGGVEALKRLRAHERHRNLPVILMTGHGRKALVSQAIAAGASACLAKPIKPSVLLETLQELMQPGAPRAGVTRTQVGQTAAARQLNGARVLLVEDNALNRRLAGEILGEAGVAVDMAEDGQQALAAVQKVRYDAVLMDVQMPVMDGFTATREIRKLPGFAQLPILAMTANARQQDREEAVAAGMNDFLPKPIDADQLLNLLTKWVRTTT